MDKTRLAGIKTELQDTKKQADHILTGEGDNYDGADGARMVRDLSDLALSLVAVIEELQLNR